MKKIVCYIDMMDRTGAQRVMRNLVTFLAEKKYEVTLVNDFDIENGDNSFSIPPSVKRVYLRTQLEGNPIVKNLQRMTTLRRTIKEIKPDVVLSFLGRPNIRMLMSTVFLKTKKIVSVRNDPNREYGNSRFVRLLTNLLFMLADGCVFQTIDASKYFCKRIVNKSKIILNPVDSSFFCTTRSEQVEGIVTFGRLEPQKNHRLLLDAYKKASMSVGYIDDLYIYGEGYLRNELQNYVEELGLINKVHFPGNVENVEEILAKSKLFVLSSDYEGLPNALMEAMAVGVPCISTDCPCGGPKTLINSKNQGILVPCNEVDSMGEAIRRCINDVELSQKLSVESRKRALEFQPSYIFEQWEEYLNCIGDAN